MKTTMPTLKADSLALMKTLGLSVSKFLVFGELFQVPVAIIFCLRSSGKHKC